MKWAEEIRKWVEMIAFYVLMAFAVYYFGVFVVGTLDKMDKIIQHDTSARVE